MTRELPLEGFTMKLASTETYRQNRAKFTLDELNKFAGRWVAFSPDGHQIIDSADTIAQLADQLEAANHDPQDVVLERIEIDGDEIFLGGAELL